MLDEIKKLDDVIFMTILIVLSIFLVSLIFAFVFSLVSGQLQMFAFEMAKSFLSLAFVAALGGLLGALVKLLLDNYSKNQEARTRKRDFRRALLDDMKSIHDKVVRARLFISAHRSALSYRDQLNLLMDARIELRNVHNAIDTGKKDLIPETKPFLEDRLKYMLDYLDKLGNEYQNNYIYVSRRQKYDEAWNNQYIKQYVEKEFTSTNTKSGEMPSKNKVETIVGTDKALDELYLQTAWKRLEDPKVFPLLNDLRFSGYCYDGFFETPYIEIVRNLRHQIIDPDEKAPDMPPLAKKNWDDCVRKAREGIFIDPAQKST